MTQYQRDEARMGEFYQDKLSLNHHTVLNYFLARPVRLEISPTIVIAQEVQFPDVSFYQAEINYSKMCLQTKAIIVRAGQNTWIDDQFERNYLEAKKCGMKVGIYWFFDGRASPLQQANLLISLLRNKTLEMEVWIDWERNYGGQHEGLRNVVAMMELIEKAGLNIKGVGLYTGYYFFRSNSNPIANASQYEYLKRHALWLAWYTNNPSDVLIPPPWTELLLWQYGTPVIDWGQATLEIDMNWFSKSKQEFEERYGTINGGEPPMTSYIKLESTTSVGRSVRQQTAYPLVPHILGTKIGSLLANNHAKANIGGKYEYASDISYDGVVRAKQGDIWWNVYEVNGQPTSGWIAEKHMGEILLVVTPVNVDPEPIPTLPTLNVQLSDTEGNYPTINIEWKPNDSSN